MSENGHRILSVEEILTAKDLTDEIVPIPEWGGAVRVRGLTRAEIHQAQKLATLRHNTQSQKAGEVDPTRQEMFYVMFGLVEPKFTQTQLVDLTQKSAGAIQRILSAINRLSGADQTVDQAEATFQGES